MKSPSLFGILGCVGSNVNKRLAVDERSCMGIESGHRFVHGGDASSRVTSVFTATCALEDIPAADAGVAYWCGQAAPTFVTGSTVMS
jgi:hypothetical protein